MVFGQTATTAIDLSAVAAGTGGFVINGQGASDHSGNSVAAAGDVNGDGLADLIVGAKYADPSGISNAGSSYVIFGSTAGVFASTAVDQMGTTGADNLTGTAGAETIVAGAGNDTLTGNGGADVLYGGAGNDNFVISADNIAKLGLGVTSGNYARIDGGSGTDTLTLAGSGVSLDLTAIANQGGAAPSSASRIESIERIDLTGTGNNSLTLSARDVVDMAGMNSFNNAGSWVDGTYNLAAGGANGASPEQRHQLVVDGNTGDVVTLSDSVNWTYVGNVTNSGHTYGVYNYATSAAQVLIDIAVTNVAPTGSVAIGGIPTQGETLTASNTLADADGLGTIGYQWKAAGTDITGATGSSYILTEAEVGKTITVVASYTDGHGTAESVASGATTAVANVNDLPTGTVSIGGSATQGQTLTASNTLADIDGLGTIGYQWKANDTNIAGATNSTLLLAEAQVGSVITVTASYTDGHGTAQSVASSPSTAVANVNDAPTGTVTIGGTPTQGQTLTASNTLADADGLGTFSYQWQAAGINIPGATSSGYTLTEAEVGKTITVVASYTDGHNTAESVVSNATTEVANVNDAPTGTVTIGGTPTQGQTLTASNTLADADGLGTVSYQWRAAGIDIAGATGSSYVLTEAEVGKAITVVASYTDGHGTAENPASAATAAVANINDAGVASISGTATQGQTLAAVVSDADGIPGTINYQWRAGGVDIGGATNSTLILAEAQVGALITVVASYTDGYGTAESVASSPTSAVANANDPPTGAVTINGTPTQGQTLTASNTLADGDGLGTVSYQWQAASINIAGAAGSTYILTETEVGKSITVVASYVDGHGTAESATSNATAAVANVNDLPTGSVTITGSPAQGETLTASNTLADADGLGTFSYQWRAGGVDIIGATNSTLVLAEAQVGALVSVTVSYTDAHGTAESVPSAATAAVANVNDAPTVVSPTADQAATSSVIFSLSIPPDVAADIDNGDTLVFDIAQADGSKLPAWLGFDAVSSTLSGIPTVFDSGVLTLRLTATDSGGLAATDDFTLAVNIGGETITGSDGNDSGVSRLTGSASDDLILGLAGNDILSGLDGNDGLDGGGGIDQMAGGQGNDIYVVDSSRDKVTEKSGAGTDTVRASIPYKLGPYVENLTLTGSGDISGTGNELVNVLTGNVGNNLLDGGKGIDTMIGGQGDDVYILDDLTETVTEFAGEGTDEIRLKITSSSTTPLSYTLGSHIENLAITGTALLDILGNAEDNEITGNAKNNSLTGLAGADTLDGGKGADTLIGGAGNDVYVIDSMLDVVNEEANADTGDLIRASINIDLSLAGYAGIEHVTLTGKGALKATGDAGNNTLTGNDGVNTLDGGTGADALSGGKGNDTYVVDDAGDVVTEGLAAGTDLVKSGIDYTLTDNVENLTLTGSGDIDGNGNALKNVLLGNDGDNVLDGGDGVDSLKGGNGDDTYVVDLVAVGTGAAAKAKLEDSVTEAATADSGNDTLSLRAGDLALTNATTLVLGKALENIDISDTGSNLLNLTGNTADNQLTGNDAVNKLDGGLGNDTLTGGLGSDVFIFSKALNADTNVDSIEDFSTAGDSIQLSKAVFKAVGAAGELNAELFCTTDALTAEARIIFDSATGALFYDADGTATASSQVQFATVTLTGIGSLASSNFVVA